MKDTGMLATVGLVALVHEDVRRAISEFNTVWADFSVQMFKIKDKIPLGNHYHLKKGEVFVLLRGSGKVILETLEKKEEQKKSIFLVEGSVVYVPKKTAHTFILEPGSEMICFSTSAFDGGDLHPYVLVK